ncbi:caspase family protein (plasmid) [Rhizobium lusitanum]|nr:caspase family protein [Rhizobium lusitanum]QND44752.1 caspase family protein [Rhizobium lusitanum]
MRKLRSVLESQGFDVSLFLDVKSADFSNVIECFIAKTVGTNPEARVVVYVASHGITRNGPTGQVGYLLPIDALLPTEDPTFQLKAVRISKFLDWAEALEVKHALFIFDACFSGIITMSRSGTPPRQPLSGYVFSDNVQKPLREFFASGTAEQEVPATSVYANLLTQALLGERIEADSNRDGYLTGTELAAFLEGSVPAYSKQTPVHGRIANPNLDIGEIVFKLPEKAEDVFAPPQPAESDTSLQPVFRSATGQSDKAIAQIYEAEKFINTAVTICDDACVAKAKATPYSITIDMPSNLPGNAVFTDTELTCKGCTDQYAIVSGPSLSSSARTLAASFASWEKNAIWKLSGKVSVPKTDDKVVVVSGVDNKVSTVDPNKLSIERTALRINVDDQKKYDRTVVALQSEEKAIRHGARKDLAELLANDDGSTAATLVRGLNTGTYRYQLGVAEALRNAPNGWRTTESASRDVLVALQKKSNDSTLRKSLQGAIDNIQVSVYYETGEDNWLTKAGQLRPKATMNPPLPTISALEVGDMLVADSSVYKRAGPSLEYGSLGILDGGKCVKLVSKDDGPSNGDNARGGWLRVVTRPCSR